MENKISAVIKERDQAAIIAKIVEVNALMPFLINHRFLFLHASNKSDINPTFLTTKSE